MRRRDKWLNGWPVLYGGMRTVLMGTGVHCIGCGRCFGTTCVAITKNSVAPVQNPDWPFDEDDCPVCEDSRAGENWSTREARRFDSWPPRTVDLYKRLKAAEACLEELVHRVGIEPT